MVNRAADRLAALEQDLEALVAALAQVLERDRETVAERLAAAAADASALVAEASSRSDAALAEVKAVMGRRAADAEARAKAAEARSAALEARVSKAERLAVEAQRASHELRALLDEATRPGAAMRWRGRFGQGKTYADGDVVEFGGDAFVSLSATSAPPPSAAWARIGAGAPAAPIEIDG